MSQNKYKQPEKVETGSTKPVDIGYGLTANVELITPSMAKIYLGINVNFRKIRKKSSKSLSNDIETGNWKLNGESIKFNAQGKMIDGQHRLYACIQSGEPFLSVVIRGVKTDEDIDTNMRRRLADYLSNMGHSDVNVLAAVLTGLVRYGQTDGYVHHSGRSRPTYSECLAYLKLHPDVPESIRIVSKVKKISRHISLCAIFHYLFSLRVSMKRANEFFEPVISGLHLSEMDSRYFLRQIFLRDKNAKSPKMRIEVAALIIKAWNAFVKEQPVKQLQWRSVGNNPEPFPRILGKRDLMSRDYD